MEKIHSILLVDDDPITNFIHEDILSSLEITDEINIASNGKEALDLLLRNCDKGNCPQLILLDLNMPVMNGFEFIEAFKKLNRVDLDTRIVVLSSSANYRDMEKVKKLDVTDYIVKPLTEEKIKDWVQEFFRSRDS